MIRLAILRSHLTGFRKSENGSAAVEMVFMVPILSWITFALVTYFAAFKAETHATRAATVITDMVSRETNPITPNYIDGIDGLLNTMINSDDAPEFRLTMVTYDEDNDDFGVAWSEEKSSRAPLTDSSVDALKSQLPSLRDGQRAILVETWVDYTPVITVGLKETTEFSTLMVAAPRFVPQLCFQQNLSDHPTMAVC